MKMIPTFIDAHFIGYKTVKESAELKTTMYQAACEKQKTEQADHMIYSHYDLEENGEIGTMWFYNGLPMTDSEFDRIGKMKKCYIGAIHKLK